MMDSDNLLKGQSYSELKESYVLFICLYDPFKQGLPVYTFKNTCEENPATSLNDKSYKVFYNASAYAVGSIELCFIDLIGLLPTAVFLSEKLHEK